MIKCESKSPRGNLERLDLDGIGRRAYIVSYHLKTTRPMSYARSGTDAWNPVREVREAENIEKINGFCGSELQDCCAARISNS